MCYILTFSHLGVLTPGLYDPDLSKPDGIHSLQNPSPLLLDLVPSPFPLFLELVPPLFDLIPSLLDLIPYLIDLVSSLLHSNY